jgi:hypothetical protein
VEDKTMKRSSLVVGLGVLAMVGGAAVVGCFGEEGVVPSTGDDAGQGADTSVAPIETSLPAEASATPDAGVDADPAVDAGADADPAADAGADASPASDASDLDAGADGDVDGGAADASRDAAADATFDAGNSVVLVDGTTYPVLGFDFNDTTLVYRDSRGFHTCPLSGCAAPVASYSTLALAPPVRFTVSGTRLYWVSAGAPATTFEIRSLDADTLTLQRKENMLFCTSVQYLRAEASATIAVYRASSSSSGSNPQTLTLNRTPNVSRTGVATEGHCVATGCQTATHTYAIVRGSIVRTPK